nr:putative ribonuclease H-like domain-containing protein [Tanacetum cinerariifolium]
NGIAERKNRTLIEAARTLLADSLLPIMFWAEAVNTACYVQNKVLVSKPHNKTPYELLHGRLPREEGIHTYVLFLVLSDGSTNSHNNNKDALVDGKEHDDDIQTRKQAGHNFISSTNDFSVDGPSNAAASPTAANSSYMPNLEDLTHSDDADDVGAEADINNLESIISINPIPTTKIYKNHLTSQIIGDLSLTT